MNDILKIAMEGASLPTTENRDPLFRPARGQQSQVVDSVLKSETNAADSDDTAAKQQKADALRPLGT